MGFTAVTSEPSFTDQGADAYEVEFIDEQGRTKSLASVPGHQLMRLNLLSLTA